MRLQLGVKSHSTVWKSPQLYSESCHWSYAISNGMLMLRGASTACEIQGLARTDFGGIRWVWMWIWEGDLGKGLTLLWSISSALLRMALLLKRWAPHLHPWASEAREGGRVCLSGSLVFGVRWWLWENMMCTVQVCSYPPERLLVGAVV